MSAARYGPYLLRCDVDRYEHPSGGAKPPHGNCFLVAVRRRSPAGWALDYLINVTAPKDGCYTAASAYKCITYDSVASAIPCKAGLLDSIT
jgi:hypothetical protein